MSEDALSYAGGGVKGALLEAGSRLNPALKMPLEWMTGQTFFQKGPSGGRPLEDLDPTIGRTMANIKEMMGGEKTRDAKPLAGSQALEFILGNSPASRLMTTTRTLTDPRKNTAAKMVNFLTGVKLSDVSPASQDAILREKMALATKRLGGKSFTRTYLPEDRKAKLSEKDQIDALIINTIQKELERRAKVRKSELTTK